MVYRYKAQDRESGEIVALKRIRLDNNEEVRSQFHVYLLAAFSAEFSTLGLLFI